MPKLYFKIINENDLECGLNIMNESDNISFPYYIKKFNFCKPKYICNYLSYGTYLCDVNLPIDNPDLEIIKKLNNKYGS